MISILSFAEKGWEPSDRVVKTLLKRMKKAGLRFDWKHCGAITTDMLLFCDNLNDTQSVEARRTNRRWKLFTESGQELNA